MAAATEMELFTARSRTCLTLAKKVELKCTAEKSPGISVRTLANLFQCGKTEVASVLKNEQSILSLYEANALSSSCHARKQPRSSAFAEVNDALYKWYQLATSKSIYPGGPQLAEKAREIAARLRLSDFRGTNRWSEKWKKWYNVRRVSICGESGDVSGVTAESWKERLPELVWGYKNEDIWNMDETGCLWRALPDKGFGMKG